MFNKQLNSTFIHSYVTFFVCCTNILFIVFVSLDIGIWLDDAFEFNLS